MSKKINFFTKISILLCLFPIIFGIIIYDKLPAEVPIHWDITGEVDNYVPKLFGVIILPVIFFIINILINIKVANSNETIEQNKKVTNLFIMILPVISCIFIPTSSLISMGVDIKISNIVLIVLGVILLIVGNYLPKIKPNNSLGIRFTWTLRNEDIWHKTHRLGGYLFTISGIIILVSTIFIEALYVLFIISILTVLGSTFAIAIYSYILYKKIKV